MLLTIRIWCWRARPALLALAAAVVVLVAARIVAPPAPHTVRVVVLAQDVAAGTSLAATDLRTVAVPPGQVPHGASAEPGDWVGRSTVVALPAGLTVVPGLLAGSRFTVPPPSGTVVVPVPVDGGAALTPGDLVDLVPAACTDLATAELGSVAGALVVDVREDQVLVATSRASATQLIMLRDACTVTALIVE